MKANTVIQMTAVLDDESPVGVALWTRTAMAMLRVSPSVDRPVITRR